MCVGRDRSRRTLHKILPPLSVSQAGRAKFRPVCARANLGGIVGEPLRPKLFKARQTSVLMAVAQFICTNPPHDKSSAPNSIGNYPFGSITPLHIPGGVHAALNPRMWTRLHERRANKAGTTTTKHAASRPLPTTPNSPLSQSCPLQKCPCFLQRLSCDGKHSSGLTISSTM